MPMIPGELALPGHFEGLIDELAILFLFESSSLLWLGGVHHGFLLIFICRWPQMEFLFVCWHESLQMTFSLVQSDSASKNEFALIISRLLFSFCVLFSHGNILPA